LWGYQVTAHFVGLNIMIVSLAFSYISAVDYSLAILSPHHGTLAEITKRISATVLGDGGAVVADPPDSPGSSEVVEKSTENVVE
jgi:hypothetical protein